MGCPEAVATGPLAMMFLRLPAADDQVFLVLVHLVLLPQFQVFKPGCLSDFAPASKQFCQVLAESLLNFDTVGRHIHMFHSSPYDIRALTSANIIY